MHARAPCARVRNLTRIFGLPMVRVRMVQRTTEQRVFVVTTHKLMQSVTEMFNYLDEGKL
jgi:hypothetical protein